jgi:hypothetical protein
MPPAPLLLPATGTVVVKINALGGGYRRSIESAIRRLRRAGVHCEVVVPTPEDSAIRARPARPLA